MTGKEAAGDDEPDANIAMNEIHVVSDEVYMPDELSTSPDGKFLLPQCLFTYSDTPNCMSTLLWHWQCQCNPLVSGCKCFKHC